MSISIATFGMFSPQTIEYQYINNGGNSYFFKQERKPVIIVDKVIQDDMKKIEVKISKKDDKY